jgi:hypothetical protein
MLLVLFLGCSICTRARLFIGESLEHLKPGLALGFAQPHIHWVLEALSSCDNEVNSHGMKLTSYYHLMPR